MMRCVGVVLWCVLRVVRCGCGRGRGGGCGGGGGRGERRRERLIEPSGS